MSSNWDPRAYERHRIERERPAIDLLSMLTPAPGGRVVDLGCGTGHITRRLHAHALAGTTLGVDSSAAMLAEARSVSQPGVRFEEGDLRDVDGEFDIVFSNAALQWLDDQAEVVARLCRQLCPGGQLAIQVPTNFGHPSHTVADRLGQELGLPPQRQEIDSLDPAAYASILHRNGLRDQEVVLRIYGNEMARTDDVIDWVRGTLLTSYEGQLGAAAFAEFLTEYRRRLLDELGDPTGAAPYFYAFPRILVWGRRP